MFKSRWLQYVAFGLVIAFACPVTGQDASQERPNQQEKSAGKTEPETAHDTAAAPKPAAVNPTITKPTSPEHVANKKKPENGKAQEPLPWYMDRGIWGFAGDTIAQWIMSIAGIAATGVSIAALILIAKTLDATREAAEYTGKAVKVAEDANAAARDAVGVTREIGQAQIRAYMSIPECNIGMPNPPNITFHFWMKNSGQSPARNVGLRICLQIFDDSGVENPIWEGKTSEIIGDFAASDPRPHQINYNPGIVDPIARDAINRAEFFKASIQLSYRDVFGADREETFLTGFKPGKGLDAVTLILDERAEKNDTGSQDSRPNHGRPPVGAFPT